MTTSNLPESLNYQSNQELEAELSAVIQSLPDAVYMGDPSGIKRCNQPALDMLGFQSIEDLNENIEEVATKINTRNVETGEKQSLEEEAFFKALMGQKVVQEVLITHVTSQRDVYIRCAAAPVMLNGEIIGAVAINSDITEEVVAKLELKSVVDQLMLKNKALDKFVYMTSHDLKAPLTSILPLLTILKDEYANKQLDEEGIKMINMCMEKADYMSDLIDNLIKTAKGEAKSQEEIDLPAFFQEILANISIPGNVHVYIKHGLPTISYHPVSLQQVFQNLISNAIKFSDKEEGIIKVDCSEDSERYIISIKDNGPGIRKENFDKIFEKFNETNEDPSKPSSGLGLSIVKEIVEENGGEIWVESTLGEGACFYFSVPKS